MSLRYWIIGGLGGWFLVDALGALGLHWLAWPVTGLLLAFAIAGSLVIRRRQRRR